MPRILKPLEIRPVLELAIADDYLADEDLAMKHISKLLRDEEIAATFRRTPDGWFMPLFYLERAINETVELIAADFYNSEEIYLVGGYEFRYHTKYLFGVESGTSFLFAREWHGAVQQLEDNGHARVWISSQTWFNLVLSGSLLEVEQVKLGTGARPRFAFRFSEYCAQLDSTQAQLTRFAKKFVPAISRLLDKPDIADLIARDLGFTQAPDLE